MLPESNSQFIAFSKKIYDIHFQTFLKLFSFCCSFRQIVTFVIKERSHPISCIPKNNISTDIICHRCLVCWTICVFMNVFEWSFFALLFLFFQNNRAVTVPFSLLSEQSRSNSSEKCGPNKLI